MTQIRDRGPTELPRATERERPLSDGEARELLKSVAGDRQKVADLIRIEVRELAPQTQQLLSQVVARELKGQLPAPLMEALVRGQAGPDLLQNLTNRLANAAAESERYGQARTPDSARAQAGDSSTPQQSLRWSQFVQATTHIPSAHLRDRAGSAAPKGEGTSLAELLGQRAHAHGGPGLRNPKLIDLGMEGLSPAQRDLLLRACVGEALADKLRDLGVQDPLMLVKAGAMPDGRAELAEALDMGRGELLTLLLRTELLKIGPGRNGELGIRPELLLALKDAGIAMLGTLAALRALPAEQLAVIYALLRYGASGFKKTMKGSRPPVKRDLIHWARTAGRRGSEIMLTDLEGRSGPLSRGDAEELVQAWYLENLLWDTLQRGKKQLDELRERRREREEREREREQQGKDGEQSPAEGLELQYDSERQDRLVCFWITDYNTDPLHTGTIRRMYVCIDPDTGAILPQELEAEVLPSPR